MFTRNNCGDNFMQHTQISNHYVAYLCRGKSRLVKMARSGSLWPSPLALPTRFVNNDYVTALSLIALHMCVSGLLGHGLLLFCRESLQSSLWKALVAIRLQDYQGCVHGDTLQKWAYSCPAATAAVPAGQNKHVCSFYLAPLSFSSFPACTWLHGFYNSVHHEMGTKVMYWWSQLYLSSLKVNWLTCTWRVHERSPKQLDPGIWQYLSKHLSISCLLCSLPVSFSGAVPALRMAGMVVDSWFPLAIQLLISTSRWPFPYSVCV